MSIIREKQNNLGDIISAIMRHDFCRIFCQNSTRWQMAKYKNNQENFNITLLVTEIID